MFPIHEALSEYHDLSLLPKEWFWGETFLNQINGFWFFTQDVPNIVRVVNEYKPLPTDVILASIPKTGTTWLKALLFSIIHRSNSNLESLLINHTPHDLVPFLEYQAFARNESSRPINCLVSDDASNVALFGTHIPYQLLGKLVDSSDCRVVYITRNPKDTLISMLLFNNKLKLAATNAPMSLEEGVEKFCSGKVPFGPYYEHVLGYKKASIEKPKKVFFISYEELMEDTKTQVERLSEFMGCPFDKEEEVEKIVKSCSFDTLSSHQVNKSEELSSWLPAPKNSFFRKGSVGDHKNYLDANTIEFIDALTRDKFHTAGFMYGI